MDTHSSILARLIPWTEEPGGLQSMRSQRVEHKLAAEQQQSKRAGIWREGRRENRRFPGKVTELY